MNYTTTSTPSYSLVKKGAAEDERKASSIAFPSCSSVVEDSQWIFGGTASGGFGPVVCLTSLSLGGNYTRSEA